MKGNIKRHFHKALSIVCASLIGILTVAYSVSMPAHAASSDWEALGEDVADLYNAYVDYFNGWSEKSIGKVIGSAVDVPLSWLKTLADGSKVISPVDDWYFYLDDDTSGGGGGRVHSGSSGGSGSDRPSSEVAPVVPSSYVSDIYSYNITRYMPSSTPSQYVWSYQSTESTSDTYPFILNRSAPLYMNGYGSWGKMNWSGVYILPFLTDDYYSFNSFYSDIFYHFYSSSDSSGNEMLYADVYNLSTGSLVQSSCKSRSWSPTSLLYLGFDAPDTASTFLVRCFSSYEDYMSNNSPTGFMSSYNGGLSGCTFVASDYSFSSLSLQSLRQASTFTPHTNGNDDWGFILSSTPFELFSNQTSIDFSQVPDNYVITISGDTIYDYSITNPDTGDTSTINYYITNNYTLPENSTDDPADNGGASGGSTSGNVNVSGEVVVGGQIDIKSDPIDINIHVNNGNSGETSSGDPYVNGEDVNLTEYLDHVPEISKGFTDYLKDFFVWLPPEIYGLLILALVVCIWCRLAGR